MITDLAGLRTDVDARFSSLGPRHWPPPRRKGEGPRDEEYSRCLDPGKYVIASQRASAWSDALEAAELAAVKRMGTRELGPWGAVETTSITARRPGTEPVFLHTSSEQLPGLIVAYGSPEVVLTSHPPCGCDACDHGSAEVIQGIDEALESIVLGEVVIERNRSSGRIVTRNWQTSSRRPRSDPRWMIGRWNGAPWFPEPSPEEDAPSPMGDAPHPAN